MAYLEIVHVIDLVLPYKILLFKTYLLTFVWGFFYRLKLQKKKKRRKSIVYDYIVF